MKFKAGDKVRIVKSGNWNCISEESIDKYIAKGVLTVKETQCNGYVLEESGNYIWHESMLEAVKTTKYVTIKEKTLKKYQDEIKKKCKDYLDVAIENAKLKGQIEAYEKTLKIKEEN